MTMNRTDINVPYAEKNQAKELGARWDAQSKTWYVPAGNDINKFSKWLKSNEPKFNEASSSKKIEAHQSF